MEHSWSAGVHLESTCRALREHSALGEKSESIRKLIGSIQRALQEHTGSIIENSLKT